MINEIKAQLSSVYEKVQEAFQDESLKDISRDDYNDILCVLDDIGRHLTNRAGAWYKLNPEEIMNSEKYVEKVLSGEIALSWYEPTEGYTEDDLREAAEEDWEDYKYDNPILYFFGASFVDDEDWGVCWDGGWASSSC